MINVLLVSPRLPAFDTRYCGDHAYTDTLLQYPPPGIRYHHYQDLIESGQARRIKWLYRIGPRLARWGILPPDMWAEYITSDYVPDILHVYGFSAVVRFPKSVTQVPTLLGAGAGSYSDLKYYLGWSQESIHRGRWMKRQYLRLIDAHDSSLRPENAKRVLVWSQFSRRMHLDEDYVRPEQIAVLYPGLPIRKHRAITNGRLREITYLFIGKDFKRKNGQLVLEAFRRVRSVHPRAKLILVGLPPDGEIIREAGVIHLHFIQRDELLERVYPSADVLVLPSQSEGFGLVLLEAMSFGMPVIGINGWAMPEIIDHGVTGLLTPLNSVHDLARNMMRFIKAPNDLEAMAKNARAQFKKRFSIEEHNSHLRKKYDECLSTHRR